MDFVDFEVAIPMKFLALKFLSNSIANSVQSSAIHEYFIHEMAKFAIPQNF